MARRDRRRATSGALAVSILVHLALFIVLAYQVAPGPRAPVPAEPDFQVQLVEEPPPAAAPPSVAAPTRMPPRPSRRAAPQPRLQTPRAVVRPAPRPQAPARAIQAVRPPPPRAPSAARAPPARASANTPAAGTAAGQAAGAGPSSGQGRWTVRGEDGEDGMRKFLRATVGCSHEDFAQLRADERANCYRRIGQDARSLGIPSDKLAGFIAAAEAREHARTGHTGPMPDLFLPCKGPGSNLDRGCINMKSDRPEDGP